MKKLGRRQALNVVNDLRSGNPCENFVEEYSSEETESLHELKECLNDVAEGNFSIVRFLKGDYGSGKSHTLLRLKNYALKKRFLVSKIEISRSQPFSYIERTVAALVKGIKVKGMRKRKPSPGLSVMLEKWAKKQDGASLIKKTEGLLQPVQFNSLKKVLFNYILSIGLPGREIKNGFQIPDICQAWISCEQLQVNERRVLEIRENVTKENARSHLIGLATAFRQMGYKGWLLIVDEQEAIPTLLTPTQRKYAWSNLRMIIDSKSEAEGIMWVFASAPEFFDSPKGIGEYQAIRRRISPATILEVGNLQKHDLRKISQKVLDIYRIAYPDWTDTLDIDLDYATTKVADAPGHAKPHFLVVALVGAFEKLKKGKQDVFESAFDKAFTEAYEQWSEKKQGN